MQPNKTFIVSICMLVASWPIAVPMGETAQESSRKEPAFAPLEEGETTYDGVIKDEGVETKVSQLSFFGHATVGGIRNDLDDSVTKLDLGNIKSIKVTAASIASKRYPEKDFAVIQKTSKTGVVSENLLLPRHIIICGIEKGTGDEKSWYLNKIDELTIEESVSVPQPVINDDRKTNVKKKKHIVRVEENDSKKNTEKPIVIKEKGVDREIVDSEKKTVSVNATITQAATNLFYAAFSLLKSIFEFIKGLFV